MADNVAITAGAGTTIATDDAGAGGHVQLVKLAISTDGSATLIPAEATNGLDVDVTRVQGTVTVSGTVSATSAGDAVHDAADSGNPIKVGGRAYSGIPAAVSAANDRTDAAFTLRGGLHTMPVDINGNRAAHLEDGALGSASGVVMVGTRVDAALAALGYTDDDASTLRVDANGALWVKQSGTVTVDGSAVTQPVSGTVAVTGVATETTLGSALTALQIMDDWDETDRAKVNIIAGQVGVAGGAGAVSALTQRVVLATDTTLPNVSGDIAHDAADSGNPVKIGTKAANAFPTAVANNDRANAISDLFGRMLTAQIDPAMQVWKSYNDTSSRAAASAQVVWDPTSGKRIAVTSLVISTYGTTAGRIFLFFAADADLTYSAGTDQPLFVGSFAPSATAKPGAVINFDPPVFCTTADRRLHYQNDAAISVDITLVGYEW